MPYIADANVPISHALTLNEGFRGEGDRVLTADASYNLSAEVSFENLPNYIVFEKKRQSALPDIFHKTWWIVSAAFKEKVEELEPGRHRFKPIQIYNGKKALEPLGEYYILNLLDPIAPIDPEKSPNYTIKHFNHIETGEPKISHRIKFDSYDFEEGKGLSFLPNKIGDRHLWMNYLNSREFIFFTEQFLTAVKHLNLKGMRSFQLPFSCKLVV